jgi:hypothetical protein
MLLLLLSAGLWAEDSYFIGVSCDRSVDLPHLKVERLRDEFGRDDRFCSWEWRLPFLNVPSLLKTYGCILGRGAIIIVSANMKHRTPECPSGHGTAAVVAAIGPHLADVETVSNPFVESFFLIRDLWFQPSFSNHPRSPGSSLFWTWPRFAVVPWSYPFLVPAIFEPGQD